MPPARSPKTAMVVAQRIVADIHARGNRIGDRLPSERHMLEQYDVGRGTLRESLRFLELQGVIALKPGPGGGPVVRRPDTTAVATSLALLLQLEGASIQTITGARLDLEPMVAGLAAQRVTEQEIASLAALEEEAEDFHRAIAHCAGNPVLGHLVEVLLGLTPEGARCGEAGAELAAHRRIREALATRDSAATTELVRDHVAACQRRSGEVLRAAIQWSDAAP